MNMVRYKACAALVAAAASPINVLDAHCAGSQSPLHCLHNDVLSQHAIAKWMLSSCAGQPMASVIGDPMWVVSSGTREPIIDVESLDEARLSSLLDDLRDCNVRLALYIIRRNTTGQPVPTEEPEQWQKLVLIASTIVRGWDAR
jgi:hypothetical protein